MGDGRKGCVHARRRDRTSWGWLASGRRHRMMRWERICQTREHRSGTQAAHAHGGRSHGPRPGSATAASPIREMVGRFIAAPLGERGHQALVRTVVTRQKSGTGAGGRGPSPCGRFTGLPPSEVVNAVAARPLRMGCAARRSAGEALPAQAVPGTVTPAPPWVRPPGRQEQGRRRQKACPPRAVLPPWVLGALPPPPPGGGQPGTGRGRPGSTGRVPARRAITGGPL